MVSACARRGAAAWGSRVEPAPAGAAGGLPQGASDCSVARRQLPGTAHLVSPSGSKVSRKLLTVTST